MRHVISTLFILWGFGLVFYYWQIPTKLPDAETADAIVIFTGGPDRIQAGLHLLSQNRGQKLLISGVQKSVQPFELIGKTIDPARVTLGYQARNTQANVQETKTWVQQYGFKKIFLVTAHYHLPRSILLLRHQLPDLDIIQYPVISQEFKRSQWWREPEAVWRFLREGHKYLLTLIRQLWV